MELKRNPFCRLGIIKEIELCSLYSLGFSTWMLSRFYKTSQWSQCNATHKYRKLGIVEKIRNNEESTRSRYSLEGKATIIPSFPASDLIPNVIEKGFNKHLDCLICVMLLTDGTALPNHIQMTNDCEIMHKVFFDLMFCKFGITPTSFRKTKRKNQTTYVRKEITGIFKKLNKFTASFKTSPLNGQSADEYLLEPQPSLDFLLKSPKEIQIEAFRLGMCAEGSITPTIQKNYLNKNYVRGVLEFACAHPNLAEQWLEITKNIGFSGFHITKNKERWSGIHGIRSDSKKDLEDFFNLGGFLNGAKVGRGSPYYSGLDKQEVLTSLLKFMKINKTVDSLKELHSNIRYLAENSK